MSEAPVPAPTPPNENQGSPEGSGLDPNVAGALSYLLGPFTGVAFLVLDKESPFVRFHAMQSIVLSIAWIALWIALTVLGVILGVFPIVGWLVNFLVTVVVALGGLALWLFLMYQAFHGQEWEVPFIGDLTRNFMDKTVSGSGGARNQP